ncbi:MAG: hypothetical protein WCF19_01935 [Chlamydiales bacterium]
MGSTLTKLAKGVADISNEIFDELSDISKLGCALGLFGVLSYFGGDKTFSAFFGGAGLFTLLTEQIGKSDWRFSQRPIERRVQ